MKCAMCDIQIDSVDEMVEAGWTGTTENALRIQIWTANFGSIKYRRQPGLENDDFLSKKPCNFNTRSSDNGLFWIAVGEKH
jgi:hypothetical protein